MFIFKLVLCQLYVQDQPTWRENSWAESDSATQKKLNDLNQHFGHAVETGRVLVICPIQSSLLWGHIYHN